MKLELERRLNLGMPPFNSLTLIVCSSPHEGRAEKMAQEIFQDPGPAEPPEIFQGIFKVLALA